MTSAHPIVERETRPALIKGWRQRCPSCGEGRMFGKYLKVNASCPACGEELHHHRADDGPAYVTMLLVCHLVGFSLPVLFALLGDWPMALAAGLSGVAVVSALWLLPRVKGAFIGLQWAKRMHGFDRAAA